VDSVTLSPFFSTDKTVFVVTDASNLDRSVDGGFTWTRMGLGLDNGSPYSAFAFSTDYRSDQTLFVGTERDGVYRSLNGGASWHNVSDGLGTEGVSLLVLSPGFSADPLVLAAGIDGGLYKAEGAAVSWRPVMEPTVRITALAFSPEFRNDQLVIAGDNRGRLYSSLDGGESWSQRRPALAATRVSAIAFSANFRNDETIFLGFYGDGVYRSSNRGVSFVPLNLGLSDRRITALAPSPSFRTDSTIFACAAEKAVFRSRLGGAFWQKFDTGIYFRDQGTVHYRSLALSNAFARDGIVFLGAFEGLFRSHDEGKTWLELEAASPTDSISGIALSPRYELDRRLWVSTYGGGVQQRSGDGNWTAQNRGLERPYIYDIAVSPGFIDDSTVFAVQLDFVAKSDSTSAWSLTKIVPAQETFPTVIALSTTYPADQLIFLGSRYTGIFRSTDGGSTYANVFPEAGFVLSMEVSPKFDSDGTAFAGTLERGVYKTIDRGDSWVPANAGLRSAAPILAMAISPSFETDEMLFAGTAEGLYRTNDRGGSWQSVTVRSDLAGAPVFAVAVSPNFVSDGRALAAVRGGGLFQTLDRGETWNEIGMELTAQGFFLQNIRFSPSFATDGTLYGSSTASLLRSTDRGVSWVVLPRPARYESSNDMIHYLGHWRVLRTEPASAYDLRYSDRAGDRCLFTFVGTGVSWVGPRSPLQGIARVYVDGALASTIDSFGSSASSMETLFTISGLPRGLHLISIEVTGEKHPEADGAHVVVDAFDVVR
jgi:photosystem II stability/assembly factor-like uncharacterized protein